MKDKRKPWTPADIPTHVHDRGFLESLFERQEPPKPQPAPKPPTRRWMYGEHIVKANTRSEARAALKRRFFSGQSLRSSRLEPGFTPEEIV